MALPMFQDQINSTDPLGGLSCTCYSAAMAGDFHTGGLQRPLGRNVRALCKNPDGTPDRTGGTTLPQNDSALIRGWSIDLDTRIGAQAMSFATFEAKVNGGQGAVLQGGYGPIHGTRFQGSETFRGNHAVFVAPGLIVMDPLCDGRRPGIYKYRGEAYPRDLVRQFAGDLLIGSTKLGLGKVWASFTRDRIAEWRWELRPLAGQTLRTFYTYTVTAGVITARKLDATTGFAAPCTPPRYYPWPGGAAANRRLVQLTAGARKGKYVEARWAQETP